jgi:hypothetical protein
MTSSAFDCAFFGYQDLPDSIELNDRKLIPIKTLKLKYEGNSMSGGEFSVSCIKSMCDVLNIPLERPIKGLYCLEEKYCKFFDYLHHLYRDGLLCDFLYYRDLIPVYHNFVF